MKITQICTNNLSRRFPELSNIPARFLIRFHFVFVIPISDSVSSDRLSSLPCADAMGGFVFAKDINRVHDATAGIHVGCPARTGVLPQTPEPPTASISHHPSI
jgi:hypothetical protein